MRRLSFLSQFISTNKKSFLFFLLVGALTAVLYFGSFTFFWKLLGISYQYALAIAYTLSVTFHFGANRNITFKNNEANFSHQVIKYILMTIGNFFITFIVVNFVVEILNFSPYIGITCAICTTVWTGYFISRFWVFRSA